MLFTAATSLLTHLPQDRLIAAMTSPEQQARNDIDEQLEETGWIVQDRDEANLGAGVGVAIREFPLESGHGFADYLLFINGQAIGVLEAKPAGHTLRGVEVQAQKYSEGLPEELDAPFLPLPFLIYIHGRQNVIFKRTRSSS